MVVVGGHDDLEFQERFISVMTLVQQTRFSSGSLPSTYALISFHVRLCPASCSAMFSHIDKEFR